MASYTEKDLSDILVDYMGNYAKRAEELRERAIAATSLLDLGLAAVETANMFSRISIAASVVVDLAADEKAVEIATRLLDNIRQMNGDLGGGE